MIIKTLEIQNFRSYYKSNVFNFCDGLNLIIGSNGDGKTTLFEALEWVFRTDDVVKTDSKGKAQLDLDLKKGEYTVNVTYVGNENYTGNNTSQKLTIEEAVTESVAESSSTSSSSSDPFEGATWHKRTHWDDGTPTQGEVYLVETTDGQLWTYDNGNYYPGPN